MQSDIQWQLQFGYNDVCKTLYVIRKYNRVQMSTNVTVYTEFCGIWCDGM